MSFSKLYHALLTKQFLIDFRRIDERAEMIHNYLTGNVSAYSDRLLSDARPLSSEIRMARSGGNPGGSGTQCAVIPMVGDLMKYGTECSYGTEEIAAKMRAAADSSKVAGIILRIDSGGGCVDAIPPMLDAIAYSQSKGKPVVALCDLCASAAYWIASGCDRILAENALCSEFGSIGVMCSFPDYTKYYEQHGIKIHAIYADQSDYKNKPFELAKEGKYELIKTEELNPLAQQFQQTVRQRRARLDEEVEGILQGRMFMAKVAVDNGLIDGIGDLQAAVRECERIISEASINQYIHQTI